MVTITSESNSIHADVGGRGCVALSLAGAARAGFREAETRSVCPRAGTHGCMCMNVYVAGCTDIYVYTLYVSA